MTSTESNEYDPFKNVSSLYGPGSVICWYLTAFSVLLSWTLHPRKRKSGSIGVDLIATLTMPAVAAGHVIFQVQSSMRDSQHEEPMDHRFLMDFAQRTASVEAPLVVTEAFIPLSVVLFLTALWTISLRRASIVSLVALLCVAAETYSQFSAFTMVGQHSYHRYWAEDRRTSFHRLFIANFLDLTLVVLVLLGLCAVICLFLTAVMVWDAKRSTRSDELEFELVERADQKPTTVSLRQRPINIGKIRLSYLRILTVSNTLVLPFLFVISLLPAIWYGMGEPTVIYSSNHLLHRLWSIFIPRTSSSLSDLDQAVALVAGATILAFNIYSIANEYYKRWASREAFGSAQPTDTQNLGDHWWGG